MNKDTSARARTPQIFTGKDRTTLLKMMDSQLRKSKIDPNASVLILGGSDDDLKSMKALGFKNILVSNIASVVASTQKSKDSNDILSIDIENIALPDNSYDVVFVHEVLHHCQSPHRGLCECLRIAKKLVIFMEPSDSLIMRLITRLGLSARFEVLAVIGNNFISGGVRDTCVPNYIYRWSAHEVTKVVSSYLPAYIQMISADAYWDFNVSAADLSARKDTHISKLTKILPPELILKLLKLFQKIANSVSIFRNQGNKFLCSIEKQGQLRPWLEYKDEKISFKRHER